MNIKVSEALPAFNFYNLSKIILLKKKFHGQLLNLRASTFGQQKCLFFLLLVAATKIHVGLCSGFSRSCILWPIIKIFHQTHKHIFIFTQTYMSTKTHTHHIRL